MNTSLRATACAALLAITAAVTATSASAAVVTGRWDPAFEAESPLEGLGWTATINFYIPNACIVGSVPTGIAVNFLGLTLGCVPDPLTLNPEDYILSSMKVLSAEVGIYDVATGDADDLLDVLRFVPETISLSRVYFNTTGVDNLPTYYIGGTSAAVSGNVDETDQCQFKVSLNDPSNRPTRRTDAPWIEYACDNAPFTRSTSRPGPAGYTYVENGSPNDTIARQIVQQTRLEVPEPGSATLALLALAAAGMTARRARR